MIKLSLSAAAVLLGFAGAAFADGMCGDYSAQTVQVDAPLVVASVPAPAPAQEERK